MPEVVHWLAPPPGLTSKQLPSGISRQPPVVSFIPPPNVDVAVPEDFSIVEMFNVGTERIVETFNWGIVEVEEPVRVNLPLDNMSPPVMVKPVADDKPPVVETLIPPVNVLVADSVTSNAPANELLVVDVAVMKLVFN